MNYMCRVSGKYRVYKNHNICYYPGHDQGHFEGWSGYALCICTETHPVQCITSPWNSSHLKITLYFLLSELVVFVGFFSLQHTLNLRVFHPYFISYDNQPWIFVFVFCTYVSMPSFLRGTWQLGGFSGVFADFPHRSLSLPFELFRIWLRIRGDIRNRKTTPRLGESGSCWLSDSPSIQVCFSLSHSTMHYYCTGC